MRAINVREGQKVHAGEVLARLDPTFSGADVSALQANVKSFQAEVDRLAAESFRNASSRPALTPRLPSVAVLGGARRQCRYQDGELQSEGQRASGAADPL